MRKIYYFALCAMVAVACNNGQQQTEEKDTHEVDSLNEIINQKNDELDELMTSFTDIQDGFARIAEAEGRINTLKNSGGEKPEIARNIQENMGYIQEIMKENRERIAQLQAKLNASDIKSAKMQEQLDKLQALYEEKVREIASLQEKLIAQDIHIQELTDTVKNLAEENENVKFDRDVKEQVVNMQDEQLNTAYYVYGTKSELKEHKILSGGEVMKGDFDKDYFTKIDIRHFDTLPLNSKSADMLSNHPAGSYQLLKDNKGMYTLKITNYREFWSVSKYLVIKVK